MLYTFFTNFFPDPRQPFIFFLFWKLYVTKNTDGTTGGRSQKLSNPCYNYKIFPFLAKFKSLFAKFSKNDVE